MPLRIGLMTDTYLPIANGVTHMVSLLAKLLAQWGHEPHVFTFAPHSDLRIAPDGLRDTSPHLFRVPEPAAKDGVHVHHAPAFPLLDSGYFLGMRYPVWMKRLLQEMDVLHVHHPFISGRLACRLRLPSQPLIFTNQTRYDIYSHYVQRVVPFVSEEAVETVGMRLTRRAAQFANRCDCVIAPSASLGQVLQTWGVQTPIEVIPNGIELTRFHACAHNNPEFEYSNQASPREAEPEKPRETPKNGAPTAVYLGRLAPEKNVEGLLRAFALAHRSVPEARLCLLGDGPSEDELRQLAQSLGLNDAVEFKGAMPYDKVPRALSQCDFFASASSSEVHPLTFIEAMAVGLPCVGTHSPGVVDTVVDGRNGWLADDRPEAFAEALIRAFTDHDERRRRAANALEDSRGYAIETTVKRVLEIYQSVLVARRDTNRHTLVAPHQTSDLRVVS